MALDGDVGAAFAGVFYSSLADLGIVVVVVVVQSR